MPRFLYCPFEGPFEYDSVAHYKPLIYPAEPALDTVSPCRQQQRLQIPRLPIAIQTLKTNLEYFLTDLNHVGQFYQPTHKYTPNQPR